MMASKIVLRAATAALLLGSAAAAAKPADDAKASLEAGVAAYEAKDMAGALAAFRKAAALDPGNAEAQLNAGVVLQQTGDLPAARDAYAKALAVPAARLTDDLWYGATVGLASVGVLLIQAERWPEAEAVLRDVVARDRNQRDAINNLALTLYRQEKWTELEPVAQRLLEMDPLNDNAGILLYTALRSRFEAMPKEEQAGPAGKALLARALAATEGSDARPVALQYSTLSGTPEEVTLTGSLLGGKAAPGAPQKLAFIFYGRHGETGRATVEVAAPAPGYEAPLEVKAKVNGPVTGYSYRLLP